MEEKRAVLVVVFFILFTRGGSPPKWAVIQAQLSANVVRFFCVEFFFNLSTRCAAGANTRLCGDARRYFSTSLNGSHSQRHQRVHSYIPFVAPPAGCVGNGSNSRYRPPPESKKEMVLSARSTLRVFQRTKKSRCWAQKLKENKQATATVLG